MLHSDNIYFADVALKIGQEKFIAYFNEKLGMDKSLPYELGAARSQLYSRGSVMDNKMLADSGYGPGAGARDAASACGNVLRICKQRRYADPANHGRIICNGRRGIQMHSKKRILRMDGGRNFDKCNKQNSPDAPRRCGSEQKRNGPFAACHEC